MNEKKNVENLACRYMWTIIRGNDEDRTDIISELNHEDVDEFHLFMAKLANMSYSIFALLERSDKLQYDIIYSKLSESCFATYK